MQARCAGVAQSVEQFTRNEKVGGSIPLSGTINPSLNANKILNIKGNQAEKYYSIAHSCGRDAVTTRCFMGSFVSDLGKSHNR